MEAHVVPTVLRCKGGLHALPVAPADALMRGA